MDLLFQIVRKIPLHALGLFVCKIPLLARRTRPKVGRPSVARDDRVSCIQSAYRLAKRARDDRVYCIQCSKMTQNYFLNMTIRPFSQKLLSVHSIYRHNYGTIHSTYLK